MSELSIIVNPAADNGETRRFWPHAAHALREAGLEFETTHTTGPGDATRLAELAGRNGGRIVMYVGGDGTANEVANGIMRLPRPIRPALASLPKGTGADLPRALGLERGVDAAVARVRRGSVRWMDVARASFIAPGGAPTTRYFVNMADVGLGGYVAARVDSRSKAFGGFASFLSSIMSSFWRYENRPMRATVDGLAVFSGRAASIVVANGPYFAGGMRMAPGADPWDGRLDVVVLGDVDKRDLLVNLRRLYRGRHLDHPKVHAYRGTEVLIEAEGSVPLEMDGEHPGFAPFHVRLLPRALPVLT